MKKIIDLNFFNEETGLFNRIYLIPGRPPNFSRYRLKSMSILCCRLPQNEKTRFPHLVRDNPSQ